MHTRTIGRRGAGGRGSAAIGRGGFVMVMVVLFLFMLGVAGMTGYQLVQAEWDLASGAEESAIALAAARAGLERYVGEHVGMPGDTTVYLVDDATVTVSQRRLVVVDEEIDLYVLEAVGEMADPRFPNSPARRTVRQYARLHKMAVNPVAAFMVNSVWIALDDRATIDGDVSQCGGEDALAVVNLFDWFDIGSSNGIDGGHLGVGFGFGTFADSVAARWDILSDPAFPIPFNDGVWPRFTGGGAIPSDSFPIIRVNGNLTAGNSRDGRGFLIVTGEFRVRSGFDWRGIILAGSSAELDGVSSPGAGIDGMIVTGLNSPSFIARLENIEIDYCHDDVQKANMAAAYFELVDGTRWEF